MTCPPKVGKLWSRREFGGLGLASAMTLASGPAGADQQSLIDAAHKEGKLLVYGDSSMVPFLVEGFSKTYPGIRVTSVTGSSWQTYDRFLAENSAGRTLADVMMGGDDTLLTADKGGYLAACGLAPDPVFPPDTISPDGRYVVPQRMLTPIIYNSSATGKLALPKDWSDFAQLGQDWQDQIIIADPRNSGTALWVFVALYDALGADRAGAIITGLKRLRAEIAPNTGVQVAKVMSGERPLTPTLHMGFFKQMRDKGAPVAFILPSSGSTMQHGGTGVTRNAPHPNAGRLFVNFVMSPAGAAILSERGTYPSRTDAKVPDGFPERTALKLLPLDAETALAKRDAVIDWWQSAMGVS